MKWKKRPWRKEKRSWKKRKEKKMAKMNIKLKDERGKKTKIMKVSMVDGWCKIVSQIAINGKNMSSFVFGIYADDSDIKIPFRNNIDMGFMPTWELGRVQQEILWNWSVWASATLFYMTSNLYKFPTIYLPILICTFSCTFPSTCLPTN